MALLLGMRDAVGSEQKMETYHMAMLSTAAPPLAGRCTSMTGVSCAIAMVGLLEWRRNELKRMRNKIDEDGRCWV